VSGGTASAETASVGSGTAGGRTGTAAPGSGPTARPTGGSATAGRAAGTGRPPHSAGICGCLSGASSVAHAVLPLTRSSIRCTSRRIPLFAQLPGLVLRGAPTRACGAHLAACAAGTTGAAASGCTATAGAAATGRRARRCGARRRMSGRRRRRAPATAGRAAAAACAQAPAHPHGSWRRPRPRPCAPAAASVRGPAALGSCVRVTDDGRNCSIIIMRACTRQGSVVPCNTTLPSQCDRPDQPPDMRRGPSAVGSRPRSRPAPRSPAWRRNGACRGGSGGRAAAAQQRALRRGGEPGADAHVEVGVLEPRAGARARARPRRRRHGVRRRRRARGRPRVGQRRGQGRPQLVRHALQPCVTLLAWSLPSRLRRLTQPCV